MSSSFTSYAQNFINHIVIPPNSSSEGKNINYYVNNSNVTIQNKETYNISNNVLVINKPLDSKEAKEEEELSKAFQTNNRIIIKNEKAKKDEPYEQEILFDTNNNNNQENKVRLDKKGVPIVRGGKHKVSFVDRLGDKPGHLVQKVEIESYKALNVYNTYEDSKKGNSSSLCCIII